jgi:hypothetical protein
MATGFALVGEPPREALVDLEIEAGAAAARLEAEAAHWRQAALALRGAMAVLASALFVVAILRARMPADAVTLIAFAVALAALSFGLLAPAARAATAEAKRDAWSAFARRVRAERQVMMPGRSAPDA